MRVKKWISLVCFAAASFSSASAEEREWKNQDGNVLRGKLISYAAASGRVKIQSHYPSSRTFWYSLEKLSQEDRKYVQSVATSLTTTTNLPENLYDEHYYETADPRKWKFFDKKFCDVKIIMDYEKMLKVSAQNQRVFNNGLLLSSRLFHFKLPGFDADVVRKIKKLEWHSRNPNFYADGDFHATNINILYYLGVTYEDFKKLRWFFSREDLALYPEKIYQHIGVLDHVSRKYDHDEFFLKRLANGIPVVVYHRNSCHYEQTYNVRVCPEVYSKKRFTYRNNKIIYFKTRYDSPAPLPTDIRMNK
jgi:hypothetical protein